MIGVLRDHQIPVQGIENPRMWRPERQQINPVREVVVQFRHQRAEMGVSTWMGNALARCEMEISRHFVYFDRTVDATCVEVLTFELLLIS